MPTKTDLFQDPEWPPGFPLESSPRSPLGTGAGGRRYQRLETPGPWGASLFVKDFGPKGKQAAEREFHWHQRLQEKNFRVPRPWLVNQLQGSWQFLMEDCGGGKELTRNEILTDRSLQTALAKSIRALHGAGFEHGDLHIGNILRDESGSLLWTDFRRTQGFDSLPQAAQMRDWGHFLAAIFPTPLSNLTNLLDSFSEKQRQSALQAGWHRFRTHHRNLDRRSRRLIRGIHPTVIRNSIPTGTLHLSGQPLKVGTHSTVTRLTDADLPSWIRKEWQPTRRLEIRDALGRSKAMRSLLAAEALLRRNFRAARPFAAGSRPGQGSWLLMEDRGNLLRLQDALRSVGPGEQSHLLRSLSHLCHCLHQAGVWYRDLKPSNLLVDPEASDINRFVLIDHDRNRFLARVVPPKCVIKDLAALLAGFPDQITNEQRGSFLQDYDASLFSAMKGRWRIALDREIGRRRRARKRPPLPPLQ